MFANITQHDNIALGCAIDNDIIIIKFDLTNAPETGTGAYRNVFNSIIPIRRTRQKEYVRELLSHESRLTEKRKLSNALHNPKDGFVYLEDPNFRPRANTSADNQIPWGSYPKVIDTNNTSNYYARSAGGTEEARHANSDQQEYGFIQMNGRMRLLEHIQQVS